MSSGACNAGWVVIRNLPLPDLGLVNTSRLIRLNCLILDRLRSSFGMQIWAGYFKPGRIYRSPSQKHLNAHEIPTTSRLEIRFCSFSNSSVALAYRKFFTSIRSLPP